MPPFHNQRLLAMYRLMSDGANLMRLRLRPAEEYTYPLLDCLGALVMVAAVNTAVRSSVLNGQYGMIAFVLCLLFGEMAGVCRSDDPADGCARRPSAIFVGLHAAY